MEAEKQEISYGDWVHAYKKRMEDHTESECCK
jgi:hypothetical protein